MTENQECKHVIGQAITCMREGCEICYETSKILEEGIRIGREEALEKVLHEFEILQPKTKVEPVDLIVIPENDFWDFKEMLKSALEGKKKNV